MTIDFAAIERNVTEAEAAGEPFLARYRLLMADVRILLTEVRQQRDALALMEERERQMVQSREIAAADASRVGTAAKNLCELLATRDPQFLSGLEEDLMRVCGVASRFSR